MVDEYDLLLVDENLSPGRRRRSNAAIIGIKVSPAVVGAGAAANRRRRQTHQKQTER